MFYKLLTFVMEINLQQLKVFIYCAVSKRVDLLSSLWKWIKKLYLRGSEYLVAKCKPQIWLSRFWSIGIRIFLAGTIAIPIKPLEDLHHLFCCQWMALFIDTLFTTCYHMNQRTLSTKGLSLYCHFVECFFKILNWQSSVSNSATAQPKFEILCQLIIVKNKRAISW